MSEPQKHQTTLKTWKPYNYSHSAIGSDSLHENSSVRTDECLHTKRPHHLVHLDLSMPLLYYLQKVFQTILYVPAHLLNKMHQLHCCYIMTLLSITGHQKKKTYSLTENIFVTKNITVGSQHILQDAHRWFVCTLVYITYTIIKGLHIRNVARLCCSFQLVRISVTYIQCQWEWNELGNSLNTL
jgi:hypothetical protein